MKHNLISTALLLLSAALVLMAANCAKHPGNAIRAAEQALLDARKVKAEDCATDQYRRAENLLASAREKQAKGDTEGALADAWKARELADLAIETALENCPGDRGAAENQALMQDAEQALGGWGGEGSASQQTAGSLAEGSNVLPGGETLQRIHFEFDSEQLTAEARNILKANADLLKKYPQVMLNVEGHCDSRGTVEYNLALGNRRAERAKEYLGSLGIAADRLTPISFGEEKALDFAENEAAWGKNRRAEFIASGSR